MILAETLQAKLADWRPAGVGRQYFSESLPDSTWAIGIAADRADSLGCLTWEISLARTSDDPVDYSLTQWGQRIARQVRGLMERVVLLEVDESRGEAILRSDEPSRRGSNVQYYEILLQGVNRATVRRFKANRDAHSRREQIPFALTHEAIAQLIQAIVD